ncbi:hypothetical protein [Caulobacter phage ERS]|uniref:Uncharacterized protein n=1 Tax=Caulobacter phage ERS TaxID=3020392 RepID=A0AAE9WX08_9CAUD|nr:hypothetical protein [Caulobacter phage ERS]
MASSHKTFMTEVSYVARQVIDREKNDTFEACLTYARRRVKQRTDEVEARGYWERDEARCEEVANAIATAALGLLHAYSTYTRSRAWPPTGCVVYPHQQKEVK